MSPWTCPDLKPNEIKIQHYLKNLSKIVGFSEEETISLYDLVGILSSPTGDVKLKTDGIQEKLPQSFLYTSCKIDGTLLLKDDGYNCCFEKWEHKINKKLNITKLVEYECKS